MQTLTKRVNVLSLCILPENVNTFLDKHAVHGYSHYENKSDISMKDSHYVENKQYIAYSEVSGEDCAKNAVRK